MIVTPPSVFISFPGTVYSQFPPASEAKSTTTEPGFIASTCSFLMSLGAGLPGIKAVVIMISTSLAYFKKSAISAS